jgi:uncharacterized lipoprotein YajG
MNMIRLLNSGFNRKVIFINTLLPILLALLLFNACGKNQDTPDSMPPAEVTSLNGVLGDGKILFIKN